MKLKLKANPGGQFYFPKTIRDEWGNELELVPNLKSGVIYPAGTPAREVLKSLEVIRADFEHRAELEEKASEKQETSK
ncbi:MAG: hypothetical protein QMD10_10175 [Desulfitobacteriaceae bacterium]|nr:hypothetical protein [Desulfitobacteriaceae bacterium]